MFLGSIKLPIFRTAYGVVYQWSLKVKKKSISICSLFVFGSLLAAFFLRFHGLSRGATRSDEMNFLSYVVRGQTLSDLWRNPPWMNQIPLADSLPILWGRLFSLAPDEGMIRQPFAVLGFLTVAFCCGWIWRRRGAGLALLLGVWMGMAPFHLYHSREAYYYTLVMFASAGMMLRSADLLAQLRAGVSLRPRLYAEWFAWTLLACMAHMSVWVVAGLCWASVGVAGWRALPKKEQARHLLAVGGLAVLMALCMSRWVYRAVDEIARSRINPDVLIGNAFDWAGPRVLPVFMGGMNWVGGGLLALVLLAGLVVGLAWRSGRMKGDLLYGSVCWLAWGGLVSSFVYIFAAGGGKAKLAYFAVVFPIFLTWSVMTIDNAFAVMCGPRRAFLNVLAACAVFGMLGMPAWQIVRLDGKPTPYSKIRAWLDKNLAPGDVVLVDRWYEPWNEMAVYAPSNVTVTFTVPDEPFENYIKYKWREVTQREIEQNKAQAFIRLARNHEDRAGLWIWPETWFARHAVVTNTGGLWLRRNGFAPVDDFYAANTNRLVVDIFYDTRDDIVARARGAGQDCVAFFGKDWRYVKPWQQGDFSGYHVLDNRAVMTVYNLHKEAITVNCGMVAAAVGGDLTVQAAAGALAKFDAGKLLEGRWALMLQPGPNQVEWRIRKAGGQQSALFVRDVSFQRVAQ
jgi:hypothetical protein